MVYNKRDSKGQETNGNHDLRDKMAKNKFPTRKEGKEKFFLKHPYIEDVDAIRNTDFMKHNSSVNGRRPVDDSR